MIIVHCPICGSNFSAAYTEAGKATVCTVCDTLVRIPEIEVKRSVQSRSAGLNKEIEISADVIKSEDLNLIDYFKFLLVTGNYKEIFGFIGGCTFIILLIATVPMMWLTEIRIREEEREKQAKIEREEDEFRMEQVRKLISYGMSYEEAKEYQQDEETRRNIRGPYRIITINEIESKRSKRANSSPRYRQSLIRKEEAEEEEMMRRLFPHTYSASE
ncbi:hypothetical protein FYZ48_07065 [Gimesia chilikensis]|uniref:hypothetical protein n=1 Tax=Gimesia chilikensis TaxID=2605989 RepID=UPI0011ECAC6C|nr:hypothetical protein [Gimesia chilikensis]KAA0141026.1 hypothetical protein FYZ48_07065 [Gimesia chilikensis]